MSAAGEEAPPRLVDRIDRLLIPARTTVYPWVVLILWPVAWALRMAFGPDPVLVDFVARWTGGRMVVERPPSQLYRPEVQQQYQDHLFGEAGAVSWFVGPPSEAVALVPLGVLPYPVAAVLWTALSLAALVLSLFMLRDVVRPQPVQWRRFVVIVAAAVPTMELLFSGQSSAFVLLWLALAHRACTRGRFFLAGLIFSLALVKPHLVLLVPLLWLLERRWTALLGILVGWLGAFVVSSAVLGPRSWLQWVAALQSDLYVGGVNVGQTMKNAGLVGLLTPWLPESGWAPTSMVVVSLLAGAMAVVLVWRKAADPSLRWWMVVFVSLVVAPHAMVYDIVLAVPAIGLALARWWAPRMRVTVAITWVLFWVVPPLSIALSQIGAPGALAATPWHGVPLVILLGLILSTLGEGDECLTRPRPSYARDLRASR
ncbi:MAG: hypothetical protein DCC50_10365 [Acidobacteria bacterium]|nr:MAG: hypothetical protein DCC50_10365 [Acidobacteriota bacterium]